MGCSLCDDGNTSFKTPLTLNNGITSDSSSSGTGGDGGSNGGSTNPPYCDCNELKFKSLLMKMIWDFGFSCLVPNCLNKERNKGKDFGDKDDTNLEEHNNNKAWLLAEVGGGGCGGGQLIGGGGEEESHSVHSSFRFSFCSQVELDSFNKNKTISSSSSCPSATVLLVNLDNSVTDSRSNELKLSRIESLEKSISPVETALVKFTYAEIVSATRNFSQGRVLGRGALSYVFRGRVGFLRTAVAIKRLDKDDKESSKAFCRELMIASSLQHPNIVPLLGFCIDTQEGFFLVYKYVSSGSLEHHLHGNKKTGVKGFASFPWSVRYKVAIGIAEAIAYLHHGTERCVVHRDIKPSNILLSSKKRPKLCDFGLATWTPAPSVPFLCKTVKGTFGYLAPEYFQHGKLSDKTDVYAFGVVLLELITGRKPIEAKRPPGEENLVQWAKPLMDKGNIATDSLLDQRAKVTPKSSIQIKRMVRAASACVKSEESCRPGIDEVITLLRGEELSCPINNQKTASLRYSQLQTKSQRRNHLAVAMLGVSEFDDDDYFYAR